MLEIILTWFVLWCEPRQGGRYHVLMPITQTLCIRQVPCAHIATVVVAVELSVPILACCSVFIKLCISSTSTECCCCVVC